MNLDHWRLATGIAVTGLLYAAQHWAPLGLVPTARDVETGGWKKKRLTSYVIGTATLWIGLAIWLAPARVFWLSLAFPAIAGLCVGGGYLVDLILNWRIRAHLSDE